MKKYANQLIVLITSILLILILFNKSLVSDTIIYSYYIWYTTLLPTMMPMFIMSNILINANFTSMLPNILLLPISKLLNISKEGTSILLLSLISGFPTNAINIKSSYEAKLISLEEANHLLYINHFANPLFVLQTVGSFYLNNSKYGLIILVSHILSNLILGILLRNKNIPSRNNYISKNTNCQNNIISISIKKSIDSLLMVSVIVTIFLIISTLITHIFGLNSIMNTFISSILEMTIGLNNLAKLNIGTTFKIVLSTAIISFGGLSIHMQVINILDNKLKYKNYLMGRIYQVLISIIVSLSLIYLFIK